MITHFLGPDEVAAYASDLANRLTALGNGFPTTWFMLGVSGHTFANVVFDFLPHNQVRALRLVRVSCNRETKEVRFSDAFDVTDAARHPALLIDSSVHSGQSMLAVADRLNEVGLADIITYSLVLKRNSVLVPNFFGLLIEENDRCLFQLESIPNNRLCRVAPFGVLRALRASDAASTFLVTGTPAIDATFSSLLYERETRGSNIFVYEHAGAICGVLSFERRGRILFVDLVANSENYRGKGIGAAMMRWAETWARSTNCEAIELWAIEDRIDFYKQRRFQELGQTLDLGDAKFRLMRRKLLYNTSMIGETA